MQRRRRRVNGRAETQNRPRTKKFVQGLNNRTHDNVFLLSTEALAPELRTHHDLQSDLRIVLKKCFLNCVQFALVVET